MDVTIWLEWAIAAAAKVPLPEWIGTALVGLAVQKAVLWVIRKTSLPWRRSKRTPKKAKSPKRAARPNRAALADLLTTLLILAMSIPALVLLSSHPNTAAILGVVVVTLAAFVVVYKRR